MRIRLFWQLIVAFVILIIFGIGGTMLLIGATFRQIYTKNLPLTIDSIQQSWTMSLADYYVAHGASWDGVAPRLEKMVGTDDWFAGTSVGYVLADEHGNVVAQYQGAKPGWM